MEDVHRHGLRRLDVADQGDLQRRELGVAVVETRMNERGGKDFAVRIVVGDTRRLAILFGQADEARDALFDGATRLVATDRACRQSKE